MEGAAPKQTITELPDFELAQIGGADAHNVRGNDPALWRFVLSLAVAFNDFKDYHYILFQILKVDSKALHAKNPGQLAQISGMGLHLSRLLSSAIHELFVLIKKHKDVVDGPHFAKLLTHLSEKALKRWRTVADVALARKPDDEIADLLLRLRNNVGFHYGEKAIAKGYESFLENGAPFNDRAVFAAGDSLEKSRFFFADAAAAGWFRSSVGRERLAFEKEISPLLWDINEALHAIVVAYLKEIGDLRPYKFPAMPVDGHT